MIVAIDSNIFIYVLEQNRDFFKPSYSLLKSIEQDAQRGIASVLCFSEVLVRPFAAGEAAGMSAQLLLEGLDHVDFIPADIEVAILAGKLRAKYGRLLRTPDSIHIASAIRAEANVFITNDEDLAGLNISEIKVELLSSLKQA